MTILASLARGAIGGVVGYLVGAFAVSNGLYPTSNLCRIYGALFTGSVGLPVGARAGWSARVASPEMILR